MCVRVMHACAMHACTCVRDIRMATFTHACLIRVAHYMHASRLCVCVIYVCMYVWREMEIEEGGIERETARAREGESERGRERMRKRGVRERIPEEVRGGRKVCIKASKERIPEEVRGGVAPDNE